MRIPSIFVIALIALVIAAGPAGLRAQDLNAYSSGVPAASQEKPLPTMLRLTVTISRFQGEKKTSSVPFALVLIAGIGNRPTTIQMGSKVPVSTTGVTDGKPSTTTVWEQLGTNIQAYVESVLADGRYNMNLSVTDSQLVADAASAAAKSDGLPRFQTFKSSNSMAMRDGESLQFTVATDKASGEVVKLDVTLNVIK